MKTIIEQFENVAAMNKKLEAMIDEQEGGTQWRTKKLEVVSEDTGTEFEVIVDGVECTFCQELVEADEIHELGDTDMCEACYAGMIE